jgi:UDP-3-O-[3-hydroxymyristoyl] glucosamine N-acyltransferase
MESTTRSWTLGELAELLGGDLEGPSEHRIRRPVPAGSSDPEGITFAESAEYVSRILDTNVGAVLVPRGAPSYGVNAIQVDRPREAFGRLLALFHRSLPIESGIHPTAIVSSDASIAATASVGAYAVVERFAVIGERAKIYPFAYIGESSVLGDDVIVYPHAVLYQDIQLGAKSIVHAGAVLGADGFGFVWDGPRRTRRIKVPQVGRVVIGTDVEIGALTAVDRATAGETIVEQGVKLDNLVQVGHNCVVGEHSVIAGQTAVGGSSQVGKRNEIGGQVAINDHVVIGDDIVLAGRTGVTKDLPDSGVYWGVPAIPIITAKRVSALSAKLPEMYKRLKELEAKIEQLEKKVQ